MLLLDGVSAVLCVRVAGRARTRTPVRVGGTGVRVLSGAYLMEATAFAAFSDRSDERAADLASFAADSCASCETT